MTSSCSRAIVHSDWMVYRAEPSAWSAITGRSGTRDRCPDRNRQSLADRPAGQGQPVVPGSPRRAGRQRQRRRDRLVGDDRPFGQDRADRLAGSSPRSAHPRARRHRAASRTAGRASAASSASTSASRFRARPSVAAPARAPGNPRAQRARRSRIGEPRDGRRRVDEDQLLEPLELLRRELGPVHEPLHRGQAGAAFESRRAPLREQLRSGDAAMRAAACSPCPRSASPPSKIQTGRCCGAGSPPPRWSRRTRPAVPRAELAPRPAAHLLPGHVSGHDQRRHLAGRPNGGGDRLDRVAAELLGASRRPDPRRDVARDRLDVGLQRRVVLSVIGGVVADDAEHRDLGAPSVVEVRQPVGEPGSEVQQRRRRRAPTSARSRRRLRSRRPRTGSEPRASPAPSRARRRSGSQTYPGS